MCGETSVLTQTWCSGSCGVIVSFVTVPTPFLHHGLTHHSYHLAWNVAVLTQFPCQPCAYSGESFPSSRLWTDAEVPAEQTAAGASLSHPHQVLHLQPDEVRGDPQSSSRVAIIFSLGYTSSHQGKHLCSFCPKSSCWAHCRRAVISEATLQRAPASTRSPELLWREQTRGRQVPLHLPGKTRKASPQTGL